MNDDVYGLIAQWYEDDNEAISLLQGWLEEYLNSKDDDHVYFFFNDMADETYEFLKKLDNDV
jgi:hypothetical protein